MTKKNFLIYLTPLALFIGLLGSCSKSALIQLDKEKLFSLSLGVMADELDYVYRERILLPGTSHLYMKEGIFYISSQNMAKVMAFNSYGDLMTLIFNEDLNPQPRDLVLSDLQGNSNKRFVPWNFNRPGLLGLSGDTLLVEDMVSDDFAYFDEELLASCDRILLRFNPQGEYLDYIGREGLGGKPFPHIQDLSFRSNGEWVVTCRIPQGWMIYWYSPQGELIYRLKLDHDQLPFFKEGYQCSLTRILADPQQYKLYLMCSFYQQEQGRDLPVTLNRLYQFDLNSRTYDEGISVPDEIRTQGGKDQRFIYQLAGVTRQADMLFLSPVGYNTFMVMGMESQGKILFKAEIFTGDDHSVYQDFHLSEDGILSSISYLSEGADVSWWRTDRLFRERNP
ncbi:MAG: hypothetical protein PF447_14985 [Spirochaetaceae bacterium]|jgi:hypothetical protein|nr:hypothetical protein [Spirochaetaceae bacterium]